MNIVNQHRWPWWSWLLIFIFLAWGIGLRGPWPADEPRFAQIALEMVQSGHWLMPHRGGELYPDKPPIFMWSIALGFLLTGSMKIAFLLPSAIGGWLTLWLSYDLSRRFFNEQTAQRTVLLLLGTVQFTLQAKTAQIDMMVCALITLGNYGLLRFWLFGHQWRWYYLAWAAMGFGIITKGVGFLPALMLLPYWLTQGWQRRSRAPLSWVRLAAFAAGPLVMFAAVASWGLPMLLHVWHSTDPLLQAYRDNIMFRQTAVRYAHSLGHQKPFWYFIVNVIPLFWLPLSLLLPALARRWWRSYRQYQRPIVLMVGWAILVLIFFSLSPGKRGVYLLPALPMLAVAAGPWLAELWQARWSNNLLRFILAMFGSGLTIFTLGFWLNGWGLAQDDIPTTSSAFWSFALALGLILLTTAVLTPKRNVWTSAAWAVALCWVLYCSWGYRAMDPWRSDEQFMALVEQRVPQDAQLAVVGFKEQQLLFTHQPLTHFGFHSDINEEVLAARDWLQEAPDQRWLLLPESAAKQCWQESQWQDVDRIHRHNWVLIDGQQISKCHEQAQLLPRYHAPVLLRYE